MGLQLISSLLEKFENIGHSTRMVIASGKRPEVVSFTVPRYTVEISTENFHDVAGGAEIRGSTIDPLHLGGRPAAFWRDEMCGPEILDFSKLTSNFLRA